MIPGKTDTLAGAIITGSTWAGLQIRTRTGRPARLAIIDDEGNIIEQGRAVEAEVWHTVLKTHCEYLQSTGVMAIKPEPTGVMVERARARKLEEAA